MSFSVELKSRHLHAQHRVDPDQLLIVQLNLMISEQHNSLAHVFSILYINTGLSVVLQQCSFHFMFYAKFSFDSCSLNMMTLDFIKQKLILFDNILRCKLQRKRSLILGFKKQNVKLVIDWNAAAVRNRNENSK